MKRLLLQASYILPSILVLGLAGCAPSDPQPENLQKPTEAPSSTVAVQVNVFSGNEPKKPENTLEAASQDPIKHPAAKEPQEEFPPPPPEESREPEDFLHYYCRLWKRQDWKGMYGALDETERSDLPYSNFLARYNLDSEANGGLRDENIKGKVDDAGKNQKWKVELIFSNNRVPPRSVEVRIVKTSSGYRLLDSGIVPIDLSDL